MRTEEINICEQVESDSPELEFKLDEFFLAITGNIEPHAFVLFLKDLIGKGAIEVVLKM
jgi:hypothetical protein